MYSSFSAVFNSPIQRRSRAPAQQFIVAFTAFFVAFAAFFVNFSGGLPTFSAVAIAAEPTGPAVTPTAAATTVAAEAEKPKLPSASFPLSGDIRADLGVSGGSLVPGYSNRTNVDTGFFLRAGYLIGHGLSAGGSVVISKNLVPDPDGGATRPYDTLVGDTLLSLSWSPQEINAEGKEVPMTFPGGLRLGASLGGSLPTSRAAHLQTRLFSLSPGISVSRPKLFGKLNLAYSFGVTKNFHQYTNAAVDTSLYPSLARGDGAEQQGTHTLIGTGNTSFAFRNIVSVSYSFTDRLSLSAIYLLFNNFRYYDAPVDQFTSANAVGGRGRSDSQIAFLSLGYTVDEDELWSVSALILTSSPPFSADNKTYRFPLFDFRSLADNYTNFSFSVNRSF